VTVEIEPDEFYGFGPLIHELDYGMGVRIRGPQRWFKVTRQRLELGRRGAPQFQRIGAHTFRLNRRPSLPSARGRAQLGMMQLLRQRTDLLTTAAGARSDEIVRELSSTQASRKGKGEMASSPVRKIGGRFRSEREEKRIQAFHFFLLPHVELLLELRLGWGETRDRIGSTKLCSVVSSPFRRIDCSRKDDDASSGSLGKGWVAHQPRPANVPRISGEQRSARPLQFRVGPRPSTADALSEHAPEMASS